MSEVSSDEIGLPKPDKSSTQPKQLGKINLSETPYKANIAALAEKYYPDSKYFKMRDGSECITDSSGKTIMLFERPTEKGFTSFFSPFSPQELLNQITHLPEEQRHELAILLHLPITDFKKNITVKKIIENRPFQKKSPFESVRELTQISHSQDALPVKSTKDNFVLKSEASDLPEEHFLKLTQEQYEAKKKQQWEAVKDLPDNDIHKILYFRRFTKEFIDTLHISELAAIGKQFASDLQETSEQFAHYSLDNSKIGELQTVEPYNTKIEVPDGIKIGFILGYHHLEKPYGNLFREMFQQQCRFSSDKIKFIQIQNNKIPTGSPSRASEEEIQEAVKAKGITHIIDIHEILNKGRRYSHPPEASRFNDTFYFDKSKNPEGETYILDPTVPLWAIEQYYEGRVYPQLQYAINEQIKKAEKLIKTAGKTAVPSVT